MAEQKVEGHQQLEVETSLAATRGIKPHAQQRLGYTVSCSFVCSSHDLSSEEGLQEQIASALEKLLARPAGETSSGDAGLGRKLVHFVRHGEGHHNVLQRNWRCRTDFGESKDQPWDGVSEPYTMDTDPQFRFIDAELTEKGQGQARDIQNRVKGFHEKLPVEALVTSPLRRATQTGLIACEKVTIPAIVAVEAAHELAGKHTCDKRLDKAKLAASFPAVDYSFLQSEEDPFWGEGRTREGWVSCADRSVDLIHFIKSRKERHVVVCSHSALLLCLFNAVLCCDSENAETWFGTGEMRTCVLQFSA